MPKVSVILPTYNRAEFLRSAIESVLKQTYTDLEIIVSDDKSTDHTEEVVRSFKDERIKYIRNKGNKGVSAARNSAIMASKGEYIAFLDDDDEWLPDKLKRQVEVLDHSRPNTCGIHSNLLVIDKTTGNIIPFDPVTKKFKGNLLNQFSIGDPIRTSTVIIRKRCLDEIGLFDETISYMEDRDLWVRLSINWDFEYISKSLIKYYVHGNAQLSQNLDAQTAGQEKILERYPHLFKKNKKYYGESYVQLGVWYCQLKKMKEGRKNIVKGIKIYPSNTIAYFHLFSSFLGPSNYQRMRKFYKSAQLKF